MKKALLTLLTVFSTLSLFAQQPQYGGGNGGSRPQQGPSITGRITGILVDTATRQPVEFATVVLINAQTQKQVDGTMTDEKGEFKFPEARMGKYRLEISFLGYQNKVVPGIELTPEKPDFNVENVYLAGEGVTLDAVEVTGEAAVIENRIDKIVYNADKDVTTQGGDAADVLQRVPLLAVDVEGNVSLRGSSNILVLINGKPSTIFSSNLADALKSIPADQIKSVEVITTPTAKYDGEGTAGIINIITKKKNAEGFTGSFNASVGTRSNRGSLNLGYARGRFGLNFSGSGWYNWPRNSTSDFLRVDTLLSAGNSANLRTLQQSGEGNSNFYGPRASVSAFYDINAFNAITSSFNFRGFGRNSEQLTDASYIDPLNDIDQLYQRFSDTRSFRNGFDWTTDYKRTFQRSKEQELSFAFQISGDRSLAENEFQQNDLRGDFPELNIGNRNDNQGLNLEYTFQGDYVHPFTDAVKLETGAKAVLRRINSDYQYENIGDGVAIPDTSDVFYYDQDVWAAYASLNFKIGQNWGLIAGSRYERTQIGGDFDKSPATFSNAYDNFLPSVILSRKLGQFSSVKASYSRRIQRPSLFYINPYLQLSDPREVTIGNPLLDPEITDQGELSYNTYIKGVVLNASLFYRYTTDIIESFVTVVDTNNIEGVSVTTFRNIGNNQSIGLNLFSSATIKKILTLRAGFNIYSYNARSNVSDLDLARQAVIWRANLNATISLPKDFKVEMFGFYNSPSQTLQGSRASYSQFSIGAQKEFLDKRASIGLSIIQPFTEYLRFPQQLEGKGFRQESEFATQVRSFNVNFSYRFGKIDFRNQRRRDSRINNDDMKGGDDGNMQ